MEEGEEGVHGGGVRVRWRGGRGWVGGGYWQATPLRNSRIFRQKLLALISVHDARSGNQHLKCGGALKIVVQALSSLRLRTPDIVDNPHHDCRSKRSEAHEDQ